MKITVKDSYSHGTSTIIPYPAIERHGMIGDRHTAALVSGDGVIDWFCLPDFDGTIVFGALLDDERGGHWKLGPKFKISGQQSYLKDTAAMETRWKVFSGELLLRDIMCLAGESVCTNGQSRILVRVLECLNGEATCLMDLMPGCNFQLHHDRIHKIRNGYRVRSGETSFFVFSNRRMRHSGGHIYGDFKLKSGQKVWAILESSPKPSTWTDEKVTEAFDQTVQYWTSWVKQIRHKGSRRNAICRSAITAHLLTYKPQGSVVAAPTTSIPERIGGHWNADYRLSWIRDASLSLAMLGMLGDRSETEHYLKWITKLESAHGLPLQTVYGIHGERETPQRDLKNTSGYRCSPPVRIGNHAFRQLQTGSLGFLTDCVWLYLRENGNWLNEYWDLIRRIADYVQKNWDKPDNGIWELPKRKHYVSTRVMCWVALDRAVKIAKQVNPSYETEHWKKERDKIHLEVMSKGWSSKLQSFKQRYDSDSLDSATLLISVMEFLPARHPRVLSTIRKIEEVLTIDGCVYRFSPKATPQVSKLPMGEMEGAFLPCTFWLATAYAKAGEIARAEEILARVEAISGDTGILAEAVDPRTSSFLGNSPLLFSHMEYVRAILEIERARRRTKKRELRCSLEIILATFLYQPVRSYSAKIYEQTRRSGRSFCSNSWHTDCKRKISCLNQLWSTKGLGLQCYSPGSGVEWTQSAIWVYINFLRHTLFSLLVALPATAMGIQNAAFRRAGRLKLRTTFISGVLSIMADAVVAYIFWRHDKRMDNRNPSKGREYLEMAFVCGGIWLAYLIGAVTGGYAQRHWSFSGLCLPLAGIVFIIILDLISPIFGGNKPGPRPSTMIP